MGSSEKRRAALVKSGIVDHVIILFGFWFFLFDMTTLLQLGVITCFLLEKTACISGLFRPYLAKISLMKTQPIIFF